MSTAGLQPAVDINAQKMRISCCRDSKNEYVADKLHLSAMSTHFEMASVGKNYLDTIDFSQIQMPVFDRLVGAQHLCNVGDPV